MKITVIDEKSEHLKRVKELGYKNSRTLGFLPEGAFDDYAERKQIIVALNSQKECIGYLLYRTSNKKVSIVHLCIDSNYRRRGIARKLVQFLSNNTKTYRGIGLLCRRDYEASKIWPKLGFSARNEKVGRSKEGKLLTYWWRDHGHPNLWSTYNKELLETKIKVVIDANIFFDLKDRPYIEESQSLLSDWLKEYLVLCITEELYNEIDRNKNKHQRKQGREFANKFVLIKSDYQKVEKYKEVLRSIFPKKINVRDRSDLRQIAWALAGNAQFFVTRDKFLLKKENEFYEKFDLNIIRPSDLIIKLDELLNEAKYQPSRLAGTQIQINHITSGREAMITDNFLAYSEGEKKSKFKTKIRRYFSDPEKYESFIISNKNNKLLAFFVVERPNSYTLKVPLIRVANNQMAFTLVSHLLNKLIIKSSKENRVLTIITEDFLTKESKVALQENGFIFNSNTWIKFNLKGIKTKDSLINGLEKMNDVIANIYPLEKLIQDTKNAFKLGNIDFLYEIEKALWPVKIIDIRIPTYIISIKPLWAEQLFDVKLASQNLFGAKPELVFNNENVYYRKTHPNILTAPARLLWYVTDNGHLGSKHLRACSYLDNIIIDRPKKLYRKFRRLGIYRWNDVFRTAKKNLNNKIMAVKFSKTELFENPIPWEKLSKLLQELEGRGAPIQSPVRIKKDTFIKLYKKANNLRG